MLEIRFHPDSDRRDYSPAVAEYEHIWAEHGARIVALLEAATGLREGRSNRWVSWS